MEGVVARSETQHDQPPSLPRSLPAMSHGLDEPAVDARLPSSKCRSACTEYPPGTQRSAVATIEQCQCTTLWAVGSSGSLQCQTIQRLQARRERVNQCWGLTQGMHAGFGHLQATEVGAVSRGIYMRHIDRLQACIDGNSAIGCHAQTVSPRCGAEPCRCMGPGCHDHQICRKPSLWRFSSRGWVCGLY